MLPTRKRSPMVGVLWGVEGVLQARSCEVWRVSCRRGMSCYHCLVTASYLGRINCIDSVSSMCSSALQNQVKLDGLVTTYDLPHIIECPAVTRTRTLVVCSVRWAQAGAAQPSICCLMLCYSSSCSCVASVRSCTETLTLHQRNAAPWRLLGGCILCYCTYDVLAYFPVYPFTTHCLCMTGFVAQPFPWKILHAQLFISYYAPR